MKLDMRIFVIQCLLGDVIMTSDILTWAVHRGSFGRLGPILWITQRLAERQVAVTSRDLATSSVWDPAMSSNERVRSGSG